MRILVVGSGGREHALCWKLAQSPLVERLFAVPGNPGIAAVPKTENVLIPGGDPGALVKFASTEGIDLTVVGPEHPLSEGLADRLLERGLHVFGPVKEAARLESSKRFAKEVMWQAGVPTAAYASFSTLKDVHGYLGNTEYPVVVKADGLAAGKGVAVCPDAESAASFAASCLRRTDAGPASEVVIEEYLSGEEVTFFALCDGNSFVPFGTAQDHKTLLDGDRGPNTGGMGAYSPAPILDDDTQRLVETAVVAPVLTAMARRGVPFCGILYVGLMLTETGPRVLEFNVRFGDPEAQAVLPRFRGDLAELLHRAARGRLAGFRPSWSEMSAMTVVLASRGYPHSPETGYPISGLDRLPPEVMAFHAGTAMRDGRLVTSGGRVLSLTSTGTTLREAAARVYAAAGLVRFEGKQYRRDIGWRTFERGDGRP